MKSKVKIILASLVVGLGVLAAPISLAPVAMADPITQAQEGVNKVGGGGGTDLSTFIQNIINILLIVLGSIAVIMIVVGGIRYTTSNGDQAQVSGAKNTILYSVVGVVVAIMAYAIVNFVIVNL